MSPSSTTPAVSVVIPTRNRCERLRLALSSALSQRGVEVEVVVVDDASSDGTRDLVSGLGDERVRLIHNPSALGESGARNRGIEAARAPWIAFLDDDDLWAPDKLVRQLGAMDTAGRRWAYGGDVIVDERFTVLSGAPPPSPEDVMRTLPRYNSVPAGASNVVLETGLLSSVGPFDEGLRRTADWDMWLRLARHGAPAWVPAPLVANCIHPGNMSRDMSILFDELSVIAARYGIRVDRPRHHRWAAWAALVDGHRTTALRHYLSAALAGDATSIARALVAVSFPSRVVRPTARAGGGGDRWVEQARKWLDMLTDPVADDSRGQDAGR